MQTDHLGNNFKFGIGYDKTLGYFSNNLSFTNKYGLVCREGSDFHNQGRVKT